MPTYYEPPARRVFFTDGNNQVYAPKDEDTIISYTIDWSRLLSTDTIVTSTWTAEGGVSVGSPVSSNTTTTATSWVAGTDGKITNTITTTAGLTLQRSVAFNSYRSTRRDYAV